jgi:hypothetical protein
VTLTGCKGVSLGGFRALTVGRSPNWLGGVGGGGGGGVDRQLSVLLSQRVCSHLFHSFLVLQIL